jgi:uncharacterized protein (DUF1697 family)
MAAASSTWVALLRGINVGGKNILPMERLARLFAESGCCDVRTYIQSGNVVFSATAGCARGVPPAVAERIAKRFGIRSPVVLRSAAELRDIAENNPFLAAGADEATLHVAFLADKPSRDRVRALDPARSPGDTFELRGREIYLCMPRGMARTKLTNAYLDSTLATTSTVRNWRTVLKLLEMTGVSA